MLAFAVLGGPTPAQAGGQGSSNFYENANFGGYTIPVSGSGGTCINLASNWHNRISSIKYNTSKVHLYSLPNCWQESGYPDQSYTAYEVPYVGDQMNDRAKSFRIW
ncbi:MULTISPECIES: hypothetical protein [Streptomyces]|uniref:Uncharacterized protein n=1 Tax=Streptomyces lycii TaxID=2654337 RepID=A0ABQ7FFC5_9ACTN|nr:MULTISPECIES: hypothetical protein [Streptomyces]KAF4406536.1 hypothetical protein GCU69_24480 [Streptomyces lycii]PGH49116.1 hypothetical protein CRI70_19525 [Streptomyces sp. Ru87]